MVLVFKTALEVQLFLFLLRLVPVQSGLAAAIEVNEAKVNAAKTAR